MKYISKFINGVPYSRLKSRGNKDAARKWTNDVIEQAKELPVIEAACILKVTFLLPPDKFPKDFRYGPAPLRIMG